MNVHSEIQTQDVLCCPCCHVYVHLKLSKAEI